MSSIWINEVSMPEFPKLEGNKKTDVLIIGGGMAGILCAYFLKQKGVDYILAESKTICSGVTKNTTAKVTVQHGLIYDKMQSSIGTEKAKMYLDINNTALEKYAELCQNINCNFERKDAYVYSLDNRKVIESEVYALQRLGISPSFEDKIELPFKIAGAIKLKNQAQFNPLKFVAEIAKELNIFEHTHITEIRDNSAYFDKGSISAKKIIVATHFPFINKHGSYFLKQYQHRSYVIAFEDAQKINGMYVDEAMKGMSFRSYNNLLLVGGGDHRTGKKGGCYQELLSFSKKHFPNAKEKFHWATQDCMSLDGIAYIGKYSKNTSDLYAATGFNKWGMTSSMVSAMILSDMVMGIKNDYADIFLPSRSMLKPQLAANAFEAVCGMLTPTTKRCPHLGCGLRWNSAEHSWDCSCHGSRFDDNGNLINNPANGNLRIR